MNNWLVLTAGLGSTNFEKASQRVENSFQSIPGVAKVINISSKNLSIYCPKTHLRYHDFLNPETRGFGYMSWKAELCSRGIQGDFGLFDGVIWVDAGCEIYDSSWTRRHLQEMLRHATNHGIVAFTLNTPESKYTKASLFGQFPEISSTDNLPQFQTTFFIAAGLVGAQILEEWCQKILTDISTVDETESYDKSGELVNHRHDQSVFSLVCKRFEVVPYNYRFPAGNRNMISRLSATRSIIWMARNRTGKSVIPRSIKFLGDISNKLNNSRGE